MENLKSVKHELQNIISGNDGERATDFIKAVKAILTTGSKAGSKTETKRITREEEERALIEFASASNLWISENLLGNFITEGAEQKVYFSSNTDYVIKLADAIFYTCWLDYFNNLLLHNYFFSNAPCEIIGFL